MKKLLTITILLLAFALLVAVESDPSNVVGYFKKNVSAGLWKPLSLPLANDDLGINNILGDQFADQDITFNVNDGSVSEYIDGWGWFGGVEEIEYGGAYSVKRETANGNLDYYILGGVEILPITIQFLGNGYWTYFSIPDAGDVELTQNFFGNSSSDEDTLVESEDGLVSEYIDGWGWFGGLEEFNPTRTYGYYVVPGAPDFTFNYPSGRGLSQPSPSFHKK